VINSGKGKSGENVGDWNITISTAEDAEDAEKKLNKVHPTKAYLAS